MQLIIVIGGINIIEDKIKDVWVRLHSSLYPKLIEHHKLNQKAFSQTLVISDTVDMLLEEILEQKCDNNIYLGIDKYYQCLIDEVDVIVSNRILGYDNREEFIIDGLRHRIEQVLLYESK